MLRCEHCHREVAHIFHSANYGSYWLLCAEHTEQVGMYSLGLITPWVGVSLEDYELYLLKEAL